MGNAQGCRKAMPVEEAPLPRVEWTTVARKQVLPRRGDPAAKPLDLDRGKLFKELRYFIERFRVKPAGHASKRHGRLVEEAVARYCEPSEPAGVRLDPDVEAVALHIAADSFTKRAEFAAPTAVSYWMAAEGAAFAVQALGATAKYQLWDGGLKTPEHSPDFVGGTVGWTLLRRQLAAVDDAAYDEAKAAAAGLRAELPLPDGLAARCEIAFAFPGEQSWHAADVEAARAGNVQLDWLLLASLADVGLIVDLLERRRFCSRGYRDVAWRDYVYTLVDGLGPAAFEPLRRLCDSSISRADDRQRTARAIGLIVSPDVASWMVGKLGDPHVGPIAEAYLDRHPRLGITALSRGLPKAGRRRALVASVLKSLRSRSAESAVAAGRKPSGRASRKVAARAEKSGGHGDATPSVDGLPPECLPPHPERILLPEYYYARRLRGARPCFKATGEALSAEAVEIVGKLLVTAKLAEPPPALACLRETLTAESLAAYAWALLRVWQDDDQPIKDHGPLLAVALFGGDGTDTRLIDLTGEWILEQQRGSAGLAMEALSRVGTQTALAYVERQMNKNLDEGVRRKARLALERLAAERGLRMVELSDALVLAFGLDAGRVRILEYAGRSIRVSFTADFRPGLVDEQGAECTRLPKPAGPDGAAEYKSAQATWDALRKDVERTVREQSRRLERAMCQGATWRRGRQRELLVHPLLGPLARRLVWATTAEPRLRFRVAEDGSLADVHDQPIPIDDPAELSIPHPLLLAPEERAAWQRILSDYEVIQPFEQVARGVFTMSEKEAKGSRVNLVKGCATEKGRMYALKHRGWKFYDIELVRHLTLSDGSEAVVVLEVEDGQTLGHATLYKGKNDYGDRVPFSRLDAITLSEVVRDLLAAKAT